MYITKLSAITMHNAMKSGVPKVTYNFAQVFKFFVTHTQNIMTV